MSFLTANSVSCLQITSTERTKMIFFVELKRMLHPRVFSVKNCMMWCQSMVTLCLVFNPVSKSFLVFI